MQKFQLIFKTQNSLFFMRLIANYKRHKKKYIVFHYICRYVHN